MCVSVCVCLCVCVYVCVGGRIPVGGIGDHEQFSVARAWSLSWRGEVVQERQTWVRVLGGSED